jgi:6-phosphogluconolactonase/glucosamine-6-phosphate isomerase/deaminase
MNIILWTKDINSYFHFVHDHLFNYVDILPENINIPDGKVSSQELCNIVLIMR